MVALSIAGIVAAKKAVGKALVANGFEFGEAVTFIDAHEAKILELTEKCWTAEYIAGWLVGRAVAMMEHAPAVK